MVNPFETKVGNATLLIGGDQGLDQTMNYTVGITIPRSELGAAANASIDNLMSKAAGAGLKIDPLENLNIKVKVGGTFNDPKIGLDLTENSGAGQRSHERTGNTGRSGADRHQERRSQGCSAG